MDREPLERDPHNWASVQEDFSRYLEGDVAATERAFSAMNRILKGYFYLRSKSEADSQDLAQSTLLKIHLSRASFNTKLPLKTWVFVLAHRTLIDHWRRSSRRESVQDHSNNEVTQEDISRNESDDTFLRLTQRKILNQALDRLKPDDRTIVYLCVEEGLSMLEISIILGSTEGAIKVRMHRARKTLREFIEGSRKYDKGEKPPFQPEPPV